MNRKTAIVGLMSLLICLIVIGIVAQTKRKGRSKVYSLYNTAVSWQSKGKINEATKAYQELIKRFPQEEQAAEAWYKLGEIYEKEGQWQKAKEAYTKIITDLPNFKQVSDAEKRLWDMNIKILFSSIVTDKDIAYKVEPGDTLDKIAKRYNTTVDLIKRSNDLKSDLIRPAQRLKICPAKYSIIVDKSQNALTLKQDDVIFKVYPVATGKQDYFTPTGTFTIVEKLKNPDWYKRGVGIIPANSPENVLGTRWLGLSEPQYGIHGGASNEDLGKQLTEGCIRMINSDAEELFSIVPRATEVTIVD